MKTLSLFTFLLLLTVNGFSQDTIFTIEGKTILAKVAEVGTDQIKYKSAANSERQFSWIARFEVAAIHYQNGEYEVFNSSRVSTNNNTANNDGYNTSDQTTNSTSAGQTSAGNGYPDPNYTPNNQANKINNVIVGVRVVGFICRLAFLFAASGNHHNSYSSGSSHHSESHSGPRFSSGGSFRNH